LTTALAERGHQVLYFVMFGSQWANNVTIQINHQPEVTIFQFIILKSVYSSTCFGRFPAHHLELNDFSGSLWFYLHIVVTVVLCSWSGLYCYLPLAAGSKNGVTNTRCCRYSCVALLMIGGVITRNM
jgi:hypothetical protein